MVTTNLRLNLDCKMNNKIANHLYFAMVKCHIKRHLESQHIFTINN
jgi:hypothetical protein